MTKDEHAVEIVRKRLENIAYEVAAKYGLQIHTAHFSVITTEDDPKPHIKARLSYTKTENQPLITICE